MLVLAAQQMGSHQGEGHDRETQQQAAADAYNQSQAASALDWSWWVHFVHSRGFLQQTAIPF